MDAVTPGTHDGPRAVAAARAPRRVLVFHVGSLGDTLVALPSFWALREAFPGARFTLLTKRAARGAIPVGREILDGSGLFDDYLLFAGDHHAYGHNLPRWRKWLGAAQLALRLRARRYDLAVYLAPSVREPAQVQRDALFFRLGGVRRVIGLDAPETVGVLEAERLLARLRGTEVAPPPLARARRDLALTAADDAALATWLAAQPQAPAGAGPWVAFAPGTNLPAKQWPPERFEAVGHALIARHGIWPVVVGGPEDRALGARLLQAWGRGINAAGALSVRQSGTLLARCALFVGNDTGTMHLAAAAGVRCVALFSARDLPGKWEPMGEQHRVLRKDVPCAGCMRVRCDDERDRLCMRLISADEVLAGAEAALAEVAAGTDARAGR